VIRALVEHGANVNAQLTAVSIVKKAAQDSPDRTLGTGATAFMRAARSGDVEVMKYLLEHGADPKLANKDGVTALSVAAGIGYTDANRGTEAQALEAVKLCVSLGLDVNVTTDKGETPMHGAARRGANSIIQYLADQGAKVNAANKQGITPFDLAAGKGAANGAPGIPKQETMALIGKLGGSAGVEIREIAKAE
jgi:ankyrin repeat protein